MEIPASSSPQSAPNVKLNLQVLMNPGSAQVGVIFKQKRPLSNERGLSQGLRVIVQSYVTTPRFDPHGQINSAM